MSSKVRLIWIKTSRLNFLQISYSVDFSCLSTAYIDVSIASPLKGPSKSKLSSSHGSSRSANGMIGIMNFTFEEIYKATQKFSQANVIGEGGFGTVYKGQLKDGTLVAVKRAKKV